MLEVNGISKYFTPPLSFSGFLRFSTQRQIVRALDDVSFSLKKGSALAILGLNGAGKTTLLKILSTLILPDSGTVTINGLSLGRDDDRIKAYVGFMSSSERSFYWRLTGRQNLEFFSALYGLDKNKTRSKLNELFALFDVDYQDRRFDSYSTGMQQKFALMRGLLHEPELLLLDEPTKSLDYVTAAGLRALIREELIQKRRKTVIFTTHHMDEALDFADTFIIVHKGRVLGTGTLEELRGSCGLPAAGLGEIFMRLTKDR